MIDDLMVIIAAYLLGSIPTAVWLSQRFFDKDIRDYGSGNAGTTNTFRILGTKAGLIVLFVDVLKGFAAVKLAYLSGYSVVTDDFVNFQVFLGIAAVIGHIFPVFAQFKGGKGIATLFGMILGIQFQVAISLLFVFAIILILTRYVSLSSMIAGIAFPVMIFFVFKEPEVAYRVFAIATAVLVLMTHQKNITRLLDGKESKFGINKNNRQE